MMRCRFCGSTSIHAAVDHKNFSAGKALAGTVVFGPMGAGAGMMGKEINGFRCTRCGGFMEHPMDPQTERQVNDAIYSARNRKSFISYNFYKNQYPNIEDVQREETLKDKQVSVHMAKRPDSVKAAAVKPDTMKIKRSYQNKEWNPACPVYVRSTIIKTRETGDGISFDIVNQSEKTIRSLYLQAVIMDDAGDEIKTIQCVYQGENVCPGDAFSTDQVFEVGSDLAYKAEVFCEKVSFTDDTVWRTNETANVYEVERLELNQFPRFRYLFDAYNDILFNRGTIKKNKRGTVDAGSKRRPMYFPVKDEKNGYWTCTCGMPVEMNRPCPVCKCTFEELQDIFSQQYLQKKQHDTVLKRAAERAKETGEFRESLVRKEEEKKAEQYKKALAAEKSDSISQLTDAVKILERLGDYQEAGAKRAEYGERIEALKAEEAKRQKELEKKRREEYNKRLLEEEKARNRRTKGLILAVVVLIAVLAFAFIRHYFDPYQKVHRYILEYGKQDSDKRKITVKEDDILFGAYTMSLVASDHERKPFWIELSYQDPSKKRCKGEVEFRPSYVSLDVETVFDSLPVINDFDYHMNYSGRATLYCSADLSHLKEDDWYKYLKINGVWADGGYHDYVYDGLKGTSPEGEPEIQNMLAEAVFLSMRSLENILEDNDIKVTMEDLGLSSLNLTKGSTLYYWLDMNGLNVSTEDLGFNM